MDKVFFLTRSFPGIHDHGKGGAIVREAYANLLRENSFEVWIVMPNFRDNRVIQDFERNVLLIPYTQNQSLCRFLQKLGIVEDYLDQWVNRATEYLRNIVNEEDIIFSTAGGELATIKLASNLKSLKGCLTIANLHDPILYTTAYGKKICPHRYIPHVSRDNFEKKYLQQQDLIITSSMAYARSLKSKYQDLKSRIFYNHFGYIKKAASFRGDTNRKTINIVYGGNMGETQAPEILAEAAHHIKGVKLFFIGDTYQNKRLTKFKDTVMLIDKMPYAEYQKFLIENADVGFVSLKGPLANLCVPSKIYEYININLPILCAVKNEDTNFIIEESGFGQTCSRDIKEIQVCIDQFKSRSFWANCYNNINKTKDEWYMKNKITEVVELIRRAKHIKSNH